MVRDVPLPPACSAGCEPPTQTPTATLTPIPIVTPAPETVASESVAQVGTAWPSSQYAGQCGDYPETVTRWWGEVTRYPWDACTVLMIINRESTGQPAVSNYEGSGAAGLMQVMPSTWAEAGCGGSPFDGVANIACGWRLYTIDGWRPWAVG